MLSDLTVRQAKATGKPYTLADTDGLSLFVSATGAKAWHFRFSWGGKRDRMSFGTYPALSLNLKTATGTSHVVKHWIHLGEGFF